MAIGSYPRVTVEGTGPSQNPQNGQGLMLLNPSTGLYESATASTFGGGGGGDATSANQATQIGEAQTTNSYLYEGSVGLSVAQLAEFIRINTYEGNAGRSMAELLYDTANSQSVAGALQDIKTTLSLINNELISLNTAIIDGSQRVVIQDTAGDIALVNGSGQLEVKSN